MQQRPFVAFLVLAGLVALTTRADAERYMSKERFGIGLELGAPSGISGKYFLGGMVAVQGGVGIVESWGYDGFHAHAEVVWHPVLLERGRAVDIPLHVGIGARFLQHDHMDRYDRFDRCWDGRDYYDCRGADSHLGVRAPVGVSFLFKEVPMDLFVEVALVMDLMHVNNDYGYDHSATGIHGALGGRYYF